MSKAISMFVLAGLASAASASVSTTAVFSAILPGGDFVAGSGASRSSAGVPDPFGIFMPALGGGEVRSYAVWNYLTGTPGNPLESTFTLNGIGVAAGAFNYATPDLCWGQPGVATYIADVTGLVIHGGVNTILGNVDEPTGLGEGVTLLTVTSNPLAGPRYVGVFWDGEKDAAGAGVIANNQVDGENNWKFGVAYAGGAAHGFTNALDGQFAGDDFIINGGLASGLYGTFAPGEAWVGNVGPYYDHAEGDFSPFMTLGDMDMDIGSTALTSDCIGHTFGAISFPVPTPGTLALVGFGGLLAARRRR